MTQNEAAERLRDNFTMHGIEDWTPGPWEQLDAALAEERRHVIAEGLDVDLIRTWRDYWIEQQGTNREQAKTDAALSLMVRQFDALLSAEQPADDRYRPLTTWKPTDGDA